MSRQTAMLNAYVPGATDLPPETAALIARREAALGPAYRLFYEKPLHFLRGEGVWLHEADGSRYLDAYNNVASLGHCHPRVVEAIAAQAATLATHTRYLHDAPVAYAERILATMPGIDHFMFTCTGSEANDLAVRMAQLWTGGEGIIVTENAYHGVTRLVSGFSPALGQGAALDPWVRSVPAPNAFRDGDDAASDFANAVRAAVADLQRAGIKPAALIVDTIFSTDGILAGPGDLLSDAVAAIHDAGGLFIADEVQPGFGRTGDRFWGFQRYDLRPDIVTMGKPMGNGYPVAGLGARRDVVAKFGAQQRYFNTFGGNPVAVAAASAVLDVIADEGLQMNAATTGAAFRQALRETAHQGRFADVRGAGLFIGVECVTAEGAPDPTLAQSLVTGLRNRRVLISTAGAAGNVLKIRPPLIFGEDHVAIFCDAVDDTFRELEG